MPINQHLSTCLPQGIHAWMSTREGGCSAPPWDSLNLGDHVGDVPACVQTNRRRLAETLGVRPVFLQQVHGCGVIELQPDLPDGLEADACFTSVKGLACTVMVADCLPVLLWDRQAQWVAAAHGGWRGLAGLAGQGVLEALWEKLLNRGAQPGHVAAWLGPSIGPCNFEVGDEVRQAFGQYTLNHEAFFVPTRQGHWRADLPGLAKQRLRQMGIHQVMGNDGSDPWCTVSTPARFFSHRRDAAIFGRTGRMAASIWLGS